MQTRFIIGLTAVLIAASGAHLAGDRGTARPLRLRLNGVGRSNP